MKNFLLFFSVIAMSLPAMAHVEVSNQGTKSLGVTASRWNTKNNGNAIFVITGGKGRDQQLFGSRWREDNSSTSWEAGIFNLAEGAEYSAVWDRENKYDGALNTLNFEHLDTENVQVRLTTGSNFTWTKNQMGKNYDEEDPDLDPYPVFTAAGEAHITAKLILTSVEEADGTVYTATFDFGKVADDVTKCPWYKPTSFTVNTPDGKMFKDVQSVKILFENVVKKKDWVCLREAKFPFKKYVKQHEAVLNVNKQVGEHKIGEIFIQAEDFDNPHYEGETLVWTHSNTQNDGSQWHDGYGYSGRQSELDSTCDNIRIHINDQSADGSKGFNLWTEGHGSTDQGTGFAIVNFAQQQWDAEYTGTKEADGTATLDNLMNFYGAWAEYTVNADEDLYADISLRTGVAHANYAAYRNGSAKCPNVTGEGVNYFAKYGGAYRIYVDGQPIRSNWEIRPGDDPYQFQDLSTWKSNQEELTGDVHTLDVDAEPKKANSYFVWSVPDVRYYNHYEGGQSWSANYKSEMGSDLEATHAEEMTKLAKSAFQAPDFANIPLSKGKHVIKVQAMGGRTSFDEIKVQAHANSDTPTGIDLVTVEMEQLGNENAPVEFYNLQGVRVANPQGGIFIRRQGSKVTKVVIR